MESTAVADRELSPQDIDILCSVKPEFFVAQLRANDATTGEKFYFCSAGWEWQMELLKWWMASTKTIVLKARQIGITWLAGALALWYLLYKPGSRVLIVSINEAEAAKVVNRVWDMMMSLPAYLRPVDVLKPTRGVRPSVEIELRHRDGKISTLLGLPSTPKAGHGETAALVILDEFARQEYAQETRKAVLPTVAGGGKILIISTANGVSNLLTGEGNHFHNLYVTAEASGFEKKFLSWRMHPQRDDKWYREWALPLPANDRAEQFPDNEEEAFILTGDLYFDHESIVWYRENARRECTYRGIFVKAGDAKKARFLRETKGASRVFQEPTEGHSYAIGADVATGRGADYSCAYVMDLSNLRIVASLHGKLLADEFAYQLYFLGKWYFDAKIAVEMGGGYGDPVIIFLRKGTDGRPPYPNLYRHREFTKSTLPESKSWGFPMTLKTRPLVLENLSRVLRSHEIPFLDSDTIQELQTFVVVPPGKAGPSPKAQEGCNDDRVLALALTTEMFRRYGSYPSVKRRKRAKVKRDFGANAPEWEIPFAERYR